MGSMMPPRAPEPSPPASQHPARPPLGLSDPKGKLQQGKDTTGSEEWEAGGWGFSSWDLLFQSGDPEPEAPDWRAVSQVRPYYLSWPRPDAREEERQTARQDSILLDIFTLIS